MLGDEYFLNGLYDYLLDQEPLIQLACLTNFLARLNSWKKNETGTVC